MVPSTSSHKAVAPITFLGYSWYLQRVHQVRSSTSHPWGTHGTFNVFTQGLSLTYFPVGTHGTFNLYTQVASILNLCQPLPDTTRYLQATEIVCLVSRDSRTRSETGRMQLGRQSITWSSFWSRSLPGACCTTMWVLARRDWWLSLRCVRHFKIERGAVFIISARHSIVWCA